MGDRGAAVYGLHDQLRGQGHGIVCPAADLPRPPPGTDEPGNPAFGLLLVVRFDANTYRISFRPVQSAMALRGSIYALVGGTRSDRLCRRAYGSCSIPHPS